MLNQEPASIDIRCQAVTNKAPSGMDIIDPQSKAEESKSKFNRF